MRPKEVSDKLQLEKIAKDHVWKVEPSCATTGEGIFEGLVCSPMTIPYRIVRILTQHLGMALQQRQDPAEISKYTNDPLPLRPLPRLVRLRACTSFFGFLHIPGSLGLDPHIMKTPFVYTIPLF